MWPFKKKAKDRVKVVYLLGPAHRVSLYKRRIYEHGVPVSRYFRSCIDAYACGSGEREVEQVEGLEVEGRYYRIDGLYAINLWNGSDKATS